MKSWNYPWWWRISLQVFLDAHALGWQWLLTSPWNVWRLPGRGASFSPQTILLLLLLLLLLASFYSSRSTLSSRRGDYDFNSRLPWPVTMVTTSFVSRTAPTVKTYWWCDRKLKPPSVADLFWTDVRMVASVSVSCSVSAACCSATHPSDGAQLFVCCSRWSRLAERCQAWNHF